MKKVNFDNYAEDYDKLLEKETSFFSKGEQYFAKYKADVARRVINHPVTDILEFGCGTGRNLPYLKEKFPYATLHGSDISAKSLEQAKKINTGVEFYLENGKEEVKHVYDLIFVAGVFHHIYPTERDQTLELIKRRLKPNGSLLIFEHNPYNPITRRIVNNCIYDEDAILLTAGEMSTLLRNNGFEVVKKCYTLFFPERLSGLSKFDHLLGWLPLGGQYFVTAKNEL